MAMNEELKNELGQMVIFNTEDGELSPDMGISGNHQVFRTYCQGRDEVEGAN